MRWIKLLLTLMLFSAATPVRAGNAPCCSRAACCADEGAKCPMLPHGGCALRVLDPTLATTVQSSPDPMPVLDSQRFALVHLAAPASCATPVSTALHPPPRYLLLQSFRN